MHIQLMTLIPALLAIGWTLAVKFHKKQVFEGITLSICAIALVINVLVVHFAITEGYYPKTLHFIQQMFSSAIVPIAYMYFSHQMGRRWNNTTTVCCWTLMLLTLLPNLNIFIGNEKILTDPTLIRSFTINIIKNGQPVFSCHTADLTIFLQAMFTVARMFPTAKTLEKYGLMLSNKMRAFFIWWIAAVIFITFTSFISTEALGIPVVGWIFYIVYATLICSIYTMLALNFDLHPVVTKEEGEAVKVDTFIDSNKSMADRLRIMIERDKIYLKSGYSAEDAATALGTNRTYFSRMMNAEFGMRFSDLINEFRINAAKVLLTTTEMTISEVATESGFSDASYMSRKFHNAVGMTPQTYRESTRAALS